MSSVGSLTLIFNMGKTGMKSRAWREKELWCEHGSDQVWERISERVGKWCPQSGDHCMWTIIEYGAEDDCEFQKERVLGVGRCL